MKSYEIGDIVIGIDCDIELKEYSFLKKFLKHQNFIKHDFIYKVEVSKPKIPNEAKIIFENSNIKIYDDNGKIYRVYGMDDGFGDYACVQFEKNTSKYLCRIYPGKEKAFNSTKHLLELLVIEDLLLKFNGLIIHSSNICYEDKSILFCAPSGIGKSTQAELWNKILGAKQINGDRALIKKDINGKYQAMGIPFCGSSNICENESHPIRIIVLLKQGTKNSIRKVSNAEAYKRIISEVTVNIWDRKSVLKVSDIVEDIIDSIDIVELTCRPDEDAVILLRDYIELGKL